MTNYFAKAFDCMNHNFLIAILQKQSFLVNFHFMGWIKIVLTNQ